MGISITLGLIIVIVVASLAAWQKPEYYYKLMLNPYRVQRDKEYYRLVSSGFIHNGYGHLFFNMFTLYFFGSLMEALLYREIGSTGSYYLILLFLVGVIVSDIPTYLKHRNNPNYNSLGASGGVSAVVFASIMFNPLSPIYLMFIPLPIPGFIMGALYLIYSYYQSKQGRDNINHDAHFYGALFGVIFSIAIKPSVAISFFQQLATWSAF
ncbi:rhomboid family intramembrane serine protease [Flammeovirgaceae bacterium SG7u.111]|nr:rhomboid family intramembrane serine protease [Flammeovirgaceae bacterium SG7u.132]WPO36020.1 rhomboid family intramembrane serine protease [Flammeovirgaceae bacterium SG7u.111]